MSVYGRGEKVERSASGGKEERVMILILRQKGRKNIVGTYREVLVGKRQVVGVGI
jgi:hypothetical protein